MASKKLIINGCFDNESLFPSKLKTLEKESENGEFRALIVQIDDIQRSAWNPEYLGDFYFFSRMQNNDKILVSFCFDEYFTKEDITAFNLSDLKKGNTLIVLNPGFCCFLGDNRVVVGEQTTCFFLNSSVENFKLEAERLLRTKDLIENNEESECFGCGNKSTTVSCSNCKLAKFCTNDCQTESLKSHKNFCQQEEIILRLASISRHENKHGFYSFKIDQDKDEYMKSLPPFKPKIIKHQKNENDKENSIVKSSKSSSEFLLKSFILNS
jgi:hypothetical protein